jgi:Flp pilus assembly protein TadB
MSRPLPVRPAPSPVSPYATPGPVLPHTPVVQRQTYSSPLSFVGITRRTTAWIRRVGTNPGLTALAVAAGLVFLFMMYAFIAVWYFVIFFLFGIFTFPFRLLRRGQRKQEHLQREQLATMQALLVQQQYQRS